MYGSKDVKLTDKPIKSELKTSARSKLRSMIILAKYKQYTEAIYLGGLCLEIWIKYKICEQLNVDTIPNNLLLHDLKSLFIFTGKHGSISQTEFENYNLLWSMSMRYENPVKTQNDYENFIKLFRKIKNYLK